MSGSAERQTGLVDGLYAVQLAQMLPGAGGGLPAYAATDRTGARSGLMAVEVEANAPARASALADLAGFSDPGVLAPFACGPAPAGDGRLAMFVVCQAPPGPALAADLTVIDAPWDEDAVIDRLLRPVATALAALDRRRVTHRAVRPNNLFADLATGRVVLGCAWASPPAARQPSILEPPYSAHCAPAARGEGSVADDVFALGVVMLIMATGRAPMAELGAADAIQRQLELGSFEALCGGLTLPPRLADLLGGMLADDPNHRPTPALLADPSAARARRVAKRPARRATQPLLVESETVWNARMLACAMARDPSAGVRLISLGVVDHWLRRHLGDPALAGKVEEVVQPGDVIADPAAMLMRVIATLDPLAPLCWETVSLWPDAVGTLLAGGEPAICQPLRRMIEAEALTVWASLRGEHSDMVRLRIVARNWRAGLKDANWVGNLERLVYRLNPLLPCRSPMLAGAAVARLRDLLPGLEARAGQGGPVVVDRELIAFLAARQNNLDRRLSRLGDATASAEMALALLRHLAALQAEAGDGKWPRLAAWLAASAAPLLDVWRHRERRAEKQRLANERAAAGDLGLLAALFDNPAELQEDETGFNAATLKAHEIDQQLAALRRGDRRRDADARRLGQEIAAALALTFLAVRAIAAAIG